ncbi:hypothetical protein B0H63DRAFT_501510 [Podospora didyma]|uniref:inositol-3-phosphate synthase n=1 Tax=Podospora didyma TaxID=330526 RepID=A0AAE0NQB5_9PEZI|nr:hypothetical protein B0H63DRAFT_501510 [Podospora didyma]
MVIPVNVRPFDDGGNATANGPSSRELFTVNSPNVTYTDSEVRSKYTYRTTSVNQTADGKYVATPRDTVYDFKVDRKVPKVGAMLVGWGGNNGSTETREGQRSANYYGSVIMGSTMKLGTDSKTLKDVNIPFHDVLPMVHPNDLVIGGWDISSLDLAASMDRAAVLEPTLKSLVRKEMAEMVPLPSIYYPDFIAANQEDRADNLIPGSKASTEHVERVRKDIRDFKAAHNLDKVIVQWTANTERYADILPGVNDTAENLLKAIAEGHEEVSPSTVFAVACILEGAPFINGSPQNTFVPGAIELSEQYGTFIGGDDFKSGQTKMKSALKQFRSKEISKSNVVDDMVEANSVLYAPGKHPDHTVVIKYMPAVGDNKRALDEYYAEIFMGGHQTISIFNVCEDSLLASPLIIDLVLVTEMMTRIQWKASSAEGKEDFKSFHSVLSILSYMLKAPVTPPGVPVINALAKQRSCLTNIFRACVGLDPESDMTLEHRLY